MNRKPRTLRKFIYLGNSSLQFIAVDGRRFLRTRQGHSRMILDVLESKPKGYEWTSREVVELVKRNPQFRTATKPWRAVNWWLSKFKQLEIIQWRDDGREWE